MAEMCHAIDTYNNHACYILCGIFYREIEGGTLALLALQPYVAAVLYGKFFAEHQADTIAFLTGCTFIAIDKAE